MSNPSKQKGTAAETAVVKVARANGFPLADRLPQAGNKDRGDIGLCPGVIVEVKAGKVAEACADAWLADAQQQTLTEQGHAGAAVALLVTKRRAVGAANADRWWAWLPTDTFVELVTGEATTGGPNPWVRLELRDALALLRHAGYGERLHHLTEGHAA